MEETYVTIPQSYLRKIDRVLELAIGSIGSPKWVAVKKFMELTGMTRDQVNYYRKKHLGDPDLVRAQGSRFQFNYQQYNKKYNQ